MVVNSKNAFLSFYNWNILLDSSDIDSFINKKTSAYSVYKHSITINVQA